ncbi:taste receptor type 2 member 40-like [Dendropsophus ebraccatus]|uniref:taste receptor type 2 member 40-like n=1 Tax=Dendropsophus ebraccatus TaxID=150705 RepID=UPI003831558F
MGLDHLYIPPFLGTFIIILMIEILAGVLTNVFIVVVNILDWLRGQSLNSSDQLVVSLALSNFCFSCINAATIMCFNFFFQIVLVDYVFYSLYGILTYSIFSSSWLSAWLCLFFCVKIISFKQGCMAWLKVNIATVVPWLILLSQVFSIVSSLPFMWSFTIVYASNTTNESNETSTYLNESNGTSTSIKETNGTSTSTDETNGTSTVIGYKINAVYNLSSLLINCFIPFMMVMATTGRIIASLCTHTRHMKQNMEDHGPSLKAHQGAARTMMSLLILYFIFYLVELGLGFLSMMDPLYWVCFVLICSFPTIQSVIFIAGNAKLKQMWLKILKNCRKK